MTLWGLTLSWLVPPVAGAQDDPFADPVPQPQTSPSADTNNNLFNSPFSQQQFVPDIALILDISALGRNLENSRFHERHNPWQLQLHDSDAAHQMHENNGFNLNYGELTFSAVVDPFVELFSAFHLSPEGFEIEEAYATSRGLPGNLQVKAGKFLSAFGRLNSQHAHFWQFADQPLIYEAMFGSENLNEIGTQVNWLAPLEQYLWLGVELLQGHNPYSFGTAGFTGGPAPLEAVNGPNLATAMVRTSFEWGDVVLLGGLSYARGQLRQAGTLPASEPRDDLFLNGTSQVLGADISLRWLIDSYRELNWQSEILGRWLDGQQQNKTASQTIGGFQSGLYSQLMWRFAWQWRTGLRLDLLTYQGFHQDTSWSMAPAILPRLTAMLEFNPTEFSRLRLQYNWDMTRQTANTLEPLHQLLLQMNFAMGAHGAHPF